MPTTNQSIAVIISPRRVDGLDLRLSNRLQAARNNVLQHFPEDERVRATRLCNEFATTPQDFSRPYQPGIRLENFDGVRQARDRFCHLYSLSIRVRVSHEHVQQRLPVLSHHHNSVAVDPHLGHTLGVAFALAMAARWASVSSDGL